MRGVHIQRGVIALALALAGCADRVLDLDVQLMTTACGGGENLLAGASQLRFTVYGEGVDVAGHTQRIALDSGVGEVALPGIPVGSGRRLLVEVLGPADRALGRGESGPLDLDGEERLSLRIPVRPVDAFSATQDLENPASCTLPSRARAGHTATVLESGKVLLTGGFHLDAGGLPVYDPATEIYDPRTGRFEEGPRLSVPRAWHTAHHFPGTPYTLVVGGQFDGQAGRAVKVAELFDEEAGTFTPIAMLQERTRHAAVLDGLGGRLVVAGGYDQQGAALATTEVFDLSRGTFTAGPVLSHARGELAGTMLPPSSPLPRGALLFVGGYDGGSAVSSVDLVVPRPNAATFDRVDSEMKLSSARVLPHVGRVENPLTGGSVAVVAGGRSDRDAQQPNRHAMAGAERIDVAEKQVSDLGAFAGVRANGFALTLADGQLLLGGGARTDDIGQSLPLSSAAIVYASGSDGMLSSREVGDLKQARFLSAAALLQDGTVLVTGGVGIDPDSGRLVALRSAEILQPAYRRSSTSPYR